MTLIDITHEIHAGRTSVWPGDTPPSREFLMQIGDGDSVTLSTLRSTVHLGTHADGPCHYAVDGEGIDAMPLDHYIGACRVVRVDVPPRSRVTVEDLGDAPIDCPRILIDTGTFRTLDDFNEDFAALCPGLVDHLAARGVVTIGLDSPSVDIIDDADIQSHGRCRTHGMAILETLRLADVTPGRYELLAQPLRLAAFDASPVRAVLRTIQTPESE
ncbi:MAG: kynurenine formamidase [Phycisphaerae bacterium]|nr:kynurenine formamidase [Phycisphaerae bacterium]HBZ97344.1 kynurenine formamidase [Phycisphaerales bacterium]